MQPDDILENKIKKANSRYGCTTGCQGSFELKTGGYEDEYNERPWTASFSYGDQRYRFTLDISHTAHERKIDPLRELVPTDELRRLEAYRREFDRQHAKRRAAINERISDELRKIERASRIQRLEQLVNGVCARSPGVWHLIPNWFFPTKGSSDCWPLPKDRIARFCDPQGCGVALRDLCASYNGDFDMTLQIMSKLGHMRVKRARGCWWKYYSDQINWCEHDKPENKKGSEEVQVDRGNEFAGPWMLGDIPNSYTPQRTKKPKEFGEQVRVREFCVRDFHVRQELVVDLKQYRDVNDESDTDRDDDSEISYPQRPVDALWIMDVGYGALESALESLIPSELNQFVAQYIWPK